MRCKEPAICLYALDYSETSQVLCFLTRGAGVVRVLGKGTKRAKSKSGGTVDVLSEGELVYIPSRSGALCALVEFTETVVHNPLRRGESTLNAALYMIEAAAEMLAEDDPHAEVFDLLHNALLRLGEGGAPVAAVLAFFQWRILHHVGLLGELKACVSCRRAIAGEDRNVFFSSRAGGLLCRSCAGAAAERYRLDGEALAGLAALTAVQTGARAPLSDKQALAVNRLLAYHIAQQFGKELRMAKYLDSCCARR